MAVPWSVWVISIDVWMVSFLRLRKFKFNPIQHSSIYLDVFQRQGSGLSWFCCLKSLSKSPYIHSWNHDGSTKKVSLHDGPNSQTAKTRWFPTPRLHGSPSLWSDPIGGGKSTPPSRTNEIAAGARFHASRLEALRAWACACPPAASSWWEVACR